LPVADHVLFLKPSRTFIEQEQKTTPALAQRSYGDNPMANSIFDGTDQIIHEALGLRPGQHLKQISTCRELCKAPLPAAFTAGIVPLLFERIAGNRRERIPSRENWRYEPQTRIADRNRSPEVVLERAIETLAVLGDLPGWCSQVPVASGLVDGYSDKRAALDLVRIEGNTAELIELKWESDTPLFALFEVLRYGLVLLLSRQHARDFGYSGRPLIEAAVLKFVVLAPAPYYHQYHLPGLRRISDTVSRGLGLLAQAHPDLPEPGLQFLRFPVNFDLPVRSGEEVNAMREGDETPAKVRLLKAIESIEPVWGPSDEGADSSRRTTKQVGTALNSIQRWLRSLRISGNRSPGPETAKTRNPGEAEQIRNSLSLQTPGPIDQNNTDKYNLGVFGIRDLNKEVFTDYDFVKSVLDDFYIDTLVCGGGVGIERLAARYGDRTDGITLKVIPPNLQRFDKNYVMAFNHRNEEIIKQVDYVLLMMISVTDTYKHIIDVALRKRKQVFIRSVL